MKINFSAVLICGCMVWYDREIHTCDISKSLRDDAAVHLGRDGETLVQVDQRLFVWRCEHSVCAYVCMCVCP